MDVDQVLSKIDPTGWQQKKFAFMVQVQPFAAALVVLSMEFVGYTPRFECHRLGAGDGLGDTSGNGSASGQYLVDQCFNNSAASCDRIVYRSPYRTVVTEWGLVCDRAVEARTLQSLFMAGMMTASPFMGLLADKVGRKRTALVVFALQALLMGGLAAAPNYGTFAIIRFFVGCLQMGGIAAFTLATELVGPELRGLVGLMGSMTFSLGFPLLALSAYLITSWRLLMLLSSVIAGSYVLFVLTFVPQSPRWLLLHGRTDQARAVLERIARANRTKLPDQMALEVHREAADSPDRCCTLFSRPRLVFWMLTLCYTWAVHTVAYYGLTAAAASMGQGRFTSFTFSGLAELPPLFVIPWMLNRLGRRYTLSGLMAVGGLGCLLIWLLPAVYIDDHGGRLTLSLIGKLCISATFCVIYIFCAEIFPTSLRNTGFGIVNFCARAGGVVYPYTALLDQVSRDSQFLLFGALVGSSALLNLGLPETRGRPLPRTVLEMLQTRPGDKELYSPLKLTDDDDDDETLYRKTAAPK